MPEDEVGADEAGRGPSIGPLVVCALSVPRSDRELLFDLGVDDSKSLSKKVRESIYREILSYSESRSWGVGLEICDAWKIDKWMSSGSLNSLEVELFAGAIKLSAEPSEVGSIFLDACDVNADRFGRNVMSRLGESWRHCVVKSEHQMDSADLIVGAASIVAKVTRDNEIGRLSRLMGVELGSGYPSDPVTKKAIDLLCSSEEPHEALRWSWANVNRSWISKNKRPMPDRFPESGNTTQSTLGDWK
ncbi:MAG: ribonuclease HII [Euryarchaeota archaeon]|nr:ribonuclease HII [Euryarchaeota archaeon]|tara:strand:+ start:84 stop:821 length:738 start_codon:yes stop_codon:yes gene_type:complete